MSEFCKFIKKIYYNQQIRFLFVGVLNTIVGIGITCFVYFLFGLPVFERKNIPFIPMLVGTLSGHIIGTVHSYFWNRYFVFQSKDKSKKEFLRFALVYVVQYLLNLGLTALFNLILHEKPFVVTIIATLICTVISYFGHKFFSFRKSN